MSEEEWGEEEETAWLKRKLKKQKEEKEALERAEEEEKEREANKGSTYLFGHLAQNAPHMLETEDTTTEDLTTELKRKKLEILEIALKEHFEEKKRKEVTTVTDTEPSLEEDREEEKPRTEGNFCQKHDTFYDSDTCPICQIEKRRKEIAERKPPEPKRIELTPEDLASQFSKRAEQQAPIEPKSQLTPFRLRFKKNPKPQPIEIGDKTCSKCGKPFIGCIGEKCTTVCEKCQLSEGEWFESNR